MEPSDALKCSHALKFDICGSGDKEKFRTWCSDGVSLVSFVLQVSFFSSLWNHPFFTISCITLIALFFAGIHKRVVAPSMYPLSISVHTKQSKPQLLEINFAHLHFFFLNDWLISVHVFGSLVNIFDFHHLSIAARCRTVLAEYNMSCDDVSNVVTIYPAPIYGILSCWNVSYLTFSQTGKLILKPRPNTQ